MNIPTAMATTRLPLIAPPPYFSCWNLIYLRITAVKDEVSVNWHAFGKSTHGHGKKETSAAALGAAPSHPRGCANRPHCACGRASDRAGPGDHPDQDIARG